MSELFDTIQVHALHGERAPRSFRYLGPQSSGAMALPERGRVVIGRGSDAELHVNEPIVSRAHAAITFEGDAMRLTDLGSANGTRTTVVLAPSQPVPLALLEPFTVGDVLAAVVPGSMTARPARAVGMDALLTWIDEAIRAPDAAATFSLCSIKATAVASHIDAIALFAPADALVVGLSDSSLAITLPGVERERASRWLEALLAYLRSRGTDGVGSVRAFPTDGTEVLQLWPEAVSHEPTIKNANMRDVVQRGSMREVEDLVDSVAKTNASILIMGETGVGKEVLARSIHEKSQRMGRFIALNCAALPETLLESELFGHEKGAFTGAANARAGLIEASDGGTLFLDELGEMPLTTQAKLLRVLEERAVVRVGSTTPRKIDLRLVAATNRDLPDEIRDKRFRADLYYRLSSIVARIPPLRERPEDIEPLAIHFARQTSASLNRTPPRIPPEMLEVLRAYDWPGNVRELRNAIERAVLLCRGPVLSTAQLPDEVRGVVRAAPSAHSVSPPAMVRAPEAREATIPPEEPGGLPLNEDLARIERDKVVEALAKCGGNQTRAAQLLGITRRALIVRMEKYQLARPRR